MATTNVSNRNGGRTIFGLIAFATVFSLVGNEIKTVTAAPTTTGAVTGFVTEGGKIIIGGTLATAFLLLISHAGEGGQELAVGLSLVTAVSSMLVFGAPVWDLISKTLGSKPTVPLATTTTPTATTATPSTTTKVGAT